MSTHSGSIWTVRCASSSTSPSCGLSHGPIASSIPLRAAALLLGGNASDPEAVSLGACPSRGNFTSRIARHGQSDDLGLAPKTILTNCWPAWIFFWLVAAWVKSRAERPSVSGVNRQLHVQIGCKLRIRNRKDELTKQAKRNKLQIKPEGN